MNNHGELIFQGGNVREIEIAAYDNFRIRKRLYQPNRGKIKKGKQTDEADFSDFYKCKMLHFFFFSPYSNWDAD